MTEQLVEWFKDVFMKREASHENVKLNLEEDEREVNIVGSIRDSKDVTVENKELVKEKKNFTKIIKIIKSYAKKDKYYINKEINDELLKHMYGEKTKENKRLTQKEIIEILKEMYKIQKGYMYDTRKLLEKEEERHREDEEKENKKENEQKAEQTLNIFEESVSWIFQ